MLPLKPSPVPLWDSTTLNYPKCVLAIKQQAIATQFVWFLGKVLEQTFSVQHLFKQTLQAVALSGTCKRVNQMLRTICFRPNVKLVN